MQNNELETIAATMQEALHRAYALGRSDALRRVVEMVQSDELGSKTVALLSHSESPVAELPHEAAAVETGAGHSDATPIDGTHSDGPHNDNAAGLMTPSPNQHEEAKPPTSMKNFLLDYLYPLGAKK